MAKKSAARKSAAKKTAKKAAKKAVKRTAKRAAKKTARKATAKARPSVKRAKARPGPKRAKPRAATRKAAAPARDVVAVVGESDLPQIHKVAAELKSQGMKVDSILEATGMITGTSAKKRSTLARVKGVSAVEEIPPIQLPPPGSDIQ